MNTTRIADLLYPFLCTFPHRPCHSERSEESAVLGPAQLHGISTYIDLLVRWNARINLTAIREPDEIVTRHFGESLFAARHLFPTSKNAGTEQSSASLIDVGSGAGFPGIPIKIWAPHIHLVLIESNQKKATFLREVARSATLTNIDVFSARAENYPGPPADVVTLRAVEQFETALPIATHLVAPEARLALLIGESQLIRARDLAPSLQWSPPIPIPLSSNRILAIAKKKKEP
jgi:16S rRNA (guanine527-N7)-methyltransferase